MKKRKLLYLLILLVCLLVLGEVVYKYCYNKIYYLYNQLFDIVQKNDNDNLLAYYENEKNYNFNYDWLDNNCLAAHAGGNCGEYNYLNCLEGIEHSYKLGYRVFEIDFDLTNDYGLVLNHGEGWWHNRINNNEVEYTLNNFKKYKLWDEYTTLDYKDLIDLMNYYKDIYIIADTKRDDVDGSTIQYKMLIDYANSVDSSILDRIIPQVYNEKMFYNIMDLYEFDSVIYTLYLNPDWTIENVANLCVKTGIGMVTYPIEHVDSKSIALWKKLNLKIGAHTENDVKKAEDLFNSGIDLIYSDTLNPNAFNR